MVIAMQLVVQMVVADVYNHRFHKVFHITESVTHIMDRDDIFMFVLKVY